MTITLICDQTNDHLPYTIFKQQLLDLLHSTSLNVTCYDLGKDSLHHCIGCFNCWLKTPGTCTIADTSPQLIKSILHSDLFIWLTPLVYGGYSLPIKQAMDRLIPLVLPFFTLVEGEVHHCKRYKKYPDMIAIGYSNPLLSDEVTTFKALTLAQSRNFYVKNSWAYAFGTMEEGSLLLSQINELLQRYKGDALNV